MKCAPRLPTTLMLLAVAACGSSGDANGPGGGGASGGTGGNGGTIPGFEAIECPSTAPDVLADRLCEEAADPLNAPDTTFINCQLETGCLAPPSPEARDSLVVLAYNMERGLELDAQLALFSGDPRVPTSDVILISEADRGCSRTGGRNVTRELAEATGMNYAFAVEFMELPRTGDPTVAIDTQCEHGNAVLSRYPIGNVQAIRHADQRDWFSSEAEPRLGGRVTVRADVLVGETILHVYSLHLESGTGGENDDFRRAQALEITTDARGLDGPVIAGGDANTNFYVGDLAGSDEEVTEPTVRVFLDAGFLDTHRSLPQPERTTSATFPIVLDLLFANGAFFSDSSLCSVDDCGALSDHVPIWTTVALP